MFKFGIIIRSYAVSKDLSAVTEVVNRGLKNYAIASSVAISKGCITVPCFCQKKIVVPVDYDQGESFALLLSAFMTNKYDPCDLRAIRGHHSSEVLTTAIKELDVDYVAIVSNKAIDFLTKQLMDEVATAIENGAKVVGAVLPGLREVVLSGRVQNTFAVWEKKALLDAGGFQTKNGVEEIIPLMRIIEKYGQAIAVLDPADKGQLKIRESKDALKRHQDVMNTKVSRQLAEAFSLAKNLDFMKTGIMEGYPKKIII